jgi:hypothetical protein
MLLVKSSWPCKTILMEGFSVQSINTQVSGAHYEADGEDKAA